MIQAYHIPDEATAEQLVALHNEILAHNAGIRVLNRWGNFSEYSIKVKLRDVEQLLGPVRAERGDPDPAATPWRIVFGYDTGVAVDLQYYDPDQRMWETVLADVGDDVDTIVDAVTAWLREHHPASEALVAIDGRLL